jgi:hypothetical protein
VAHAVPARLTASEGRRFAFTVGGAFVVLAGLALWRDRDSLAIGLGGLGATLGLLGLLVPARLGPVNRAWMGLAIVLSKVTTPLFMGLIFFVTILPIGLVLRLLGKDPLRTSRTAATFWHARADGERRSDLSRQF